MLNATRSIFTGMFRRFGLGTIAGVVLVLGMGVAAFAYWTTVGAGAGSASASGLNPPTNVSLAVDDSAVTVSFTGVTPTNGTLSGYYVQRNNGSVTSNACGTNPATPGSFLSLSATSCVDASVPNGTYTYTVTAVLKTWTATSAASNSLVVTGDTHAPTQVLSVTSANAYKSGSLVYFRSASAGSLTVSSAVTDAISGPASAAFPAVSAFGWTHAAETVTSGTGANPKTYTSSNLSWNAGAATPSLLTVTARDVVGNASNSSLTFSADDVAPTGGALRVAGVDATAGGSTFYSTSGTFTQNSTSAFTDADSGIASSVLARSVAPYSGGVCGTYAVASTVSSATESGLATGCYKYRLVGTDNVGNTAVISVTAIVDREAPTQTLSATSSNASVTGTTLYYKGDIAGSTTLTAAITDAASGPASAAFPAIATTGWTHAAETVTAGSGSSPTSYTSSSFTWNASPSNPTGYSVTGSDVAGNTVATGLTFVSDTTIPVTGALTVNSTGATVLGTTSSSAGTFSGSFTNFTDAGAGIAASVLTRETGTFSNGNCVLYGTPVVLTSISESGLSGGCYRYTLTGTDKVGNTTSLTTTVTIDPTAPTQTFSETGANSYVNGTTLYYKSNAVGSFTISAAVTDNESGPKQSVFPAIGTTGWTHNAETVTSSTGSNPTKTFTSSSYSWTANPTNPTNTAARTVTSSDIAGNTVATALTFTADNTAPTGGYVSVNGDNGSTGGTTGYGRSDFTGTITDFTDAGSGIASQTLTRATATLSGSTCGTFGSTTTISSISETSATGCFRYVLTATDNVGNVASSTTLTVQIDNTAPTVSITESGANSFKSGSTIYYRGDLASSTVLSAAVTDGGAGPASATFPDINTTGWTHLAETVSSGSGTNPITYASSNFSWTASPSNPATYTVTGRDSAGNTGIGTVSFAADSTGPTVDATHGTLSANGVSATQSGARTQTSSSYSVAWTNFNADTESGFASSVIERAVSNDCVTYTPDSPAPTGTSISEVSGKGGTLSNDRCYRYTLTGTDNVGNTTVRSITVAFNDGTNPAATYSLTDASNAVLSGTTLYYRSTLAGSFKLVADITDDGSGPASETFPAIATAGWTHNAETVTTSTGSHPTKSYSSSTYSWTANPTNPSGGVRNMVSTDVAGNTATQVITFTADNTVPTGGSITINGTASSNGGTTAYSNGTFSATPTNFTDAGVGMGTNAITEATATLSGSTCGTFGSATTVLAIGRTGAAPGCYKYVLTGTDLLGNSTSTTITVQVEQGVPAQSVSVNSGNAFLSGSTLYYRSGVSGVFTLASAVTDDFPGPASATFPAVSGATGWTHANQTVTSGTGTNPITYVSSNFTRAAGATNPGTYTVTGADKAGNTVDTTLTTVADASAPTGGALTVAGTPGTSVGATVVTNSALFSGSYTDFSADTGSGVASSVLVRETATFASGVCGSFGNSSTITSISESALATGCYRYTLTGTDNVGNTSVLRTIVQVDVTAPTVVVTDNGSNSSQTGSTIYYRGDLASSTVVSAAVTDGASGAASATFPAISTTGWTHNAETISSAASTSGTTKTYNSSNFTWTASPSEPGSYTVTGTDAAGNTGTSAVTFTSDTTGPTGGVLTVDGVAVTSGSTIAGANAAYNVTKTNFSADAGSGYASTANITREYATLSGAVCGTFGNSSTASSFTETTGAGATLTSGRCYRYTLTGTDNVGNTTTIQRTIYFETTNPTQALTLATSSNAVLSGTTLYYRSNLAGSFTLADAVSDSGSGADSANFPAISTTNWTHNAETVTSGTGTNPKTFTSTAYSWTAGASNPTNKTITGYDLSGNSVTTSLSFTVDNTAPTGGALTVNGTGGSAGGTTSYTNTSFSGSKTNFTDAGVGIDTNVLTREFATITDGVCDSFGSATVITSISENTPAVGCYRYTLTAADLLANVSVLKTTVMVDVTAPSSVVVSETGADGYLSGSTLYFRSGISSSVTLSAAVTDAFPGAASATFPAISATNWTHNAETISSGTGSNPITYTSSNFSWTSTAVAPSGTRTISGADKAGNSTNATPISFVADASAPSGGALTVAGTPGTSVGATVVTNSALFSGSYTNFSADAGSGVASSVLVRETATFASGVCGSFGNSSTITSISESALATGCYRYTLTGTDNVGNTSVLRTIVQVDVTAPTVVVTESGSNSSQTGSTIYYRGDLASSTVLNAAVTDAASGTASATFPAIATTGWTHNAETISSAASTSGTTKTYNSSNFTWTASPSEPGSYTVTGTDAAGNTGTSAVTFTSDTTGPTGGTLTANGVAATADGAVSYISTSADYTVAKTDYSADAGSGYASTTVSRQSSTDGTCTGWNSATTITAASTTEKKPGPGSTVAANTCYKYTITGTDNVGNTSSKYVVVAFTDATAPTQTLSLTSATNAVLNNISTTASTLYYRSDLAGGFTFQSVVNDGASGPKQVVFPALTGTTGWTGATKTATPVAGTWPSATLSSNAYSWTASPSAMANKTVVASDNVPLTQTVTVTFTADNAAPTGGSITVNGTASTNGGTTAYAPNTFTASVTNFTDAGVGIGTNVITRATATLTGSTCGTFGSAAVVASISESGATGCIKYVLTGTDLLANSTTSTITVKIDGSAPTVAVSGETGANSYRDGSNIYYRSGSSGSFTLTATVDDAFPGAQSATFPAIATTGWTHNAETVSSATSASGTVTTYTSSSFTWTASPSVPATYTVTGADQSGNTGTADVTFVADAAGPTAGALTVNSVNGTSGGSTSYSKTGTFSGTFTQFSADAGSGFASSAITKESATLTNGTCGSYSAGTAPTGGSIAETTLAEGCYRYTVTGTDNVGNTSVLATVVMVDKTAPTQVISASGSNAYVDDANSKIYYNGTGSSRSFTMTSAVTEAGSGGVTVTFPSLAGTSTGFSFTNSVDSSSPFTSNSVTWSSGTTSTPTITVNATDAAGNSNDRLLTFVNDITVPTSGALSADGTSATSGGTVKNSTTNPFSLSVTDFTDAGSGLASSTLTYATATYTSATLSCGTYGSETTISKTGTPAAYPTSFANGTTKTCIRFTLTGTDNVGNTSTLIVTHTRN